MVSGTQETIQGTTTDIATMLGQEYPVGVAVVKLLKAQGLVEEVGIRKNPTGKGKGSTVFKMPKTLTISFDTSTLGANPLPVLPLIPAAAAPAEPALEAEAA